MLKVYEPYLDSWRLITKNLDGGDTAANQFTVLYAGHGSKADIYYSVTVLTKNGIPIRHPDLSKWYCSIDRTSRDQLTPYLLFVASNKAYHTWFFRLLIQHAKHFWLFTWNTRRNFQYASQAEHAIKSPRVTWNYSWKLPDICGPDIWAIYARGILTHYSYSLFLLAPLLLATILAGDTQNLLAVLISWAKYKLGRKFGRTTEPGTQNHDCRNLTLKAHFAANHIVTPLSALAWKLWKPLGREAAHSFWSQAGEPPIYLAINSLE